MKRRQVPRILKHKTLNKSYCVKGKANFMRKSTNLMLYVAGMHLVRRYLGRENVRLISLPNKYLLTKA